MQPLSVIATGLGWCVLSSVASQRVVRNYKVAADLNPNNTVRTSLNFQIREDRAWILALPLASYNPSKTFCFLSSDCLIKTMGMGVVFPAWRLPILPFSRFQLHDKGPGSVLDVLVGLPQLRMFPGTSFEKQYPCTWSLAGFPSCAALSPIMPPTSLRGLCLGDLLGSIFMICLYDTLLISSLCRLLQEA